MEPNQGNFENRLGSALFSKDMNKTFTREILATEEIGQLKDLYEKNDLTEADLRVLSYLMQAAEVKLLNFGSEDRYLIGKFGTWIVDIIKIQETNLRNKQITQETKVKDFHYKKVGGRVFKKEDGTEVCKWGDIKNVKAAKPYITPLTKKLQDQITQMLDEDLKSILGTYLYLSRSSMSLGNTAFDTLSKNRYEYEYSNNPLAPNQKPNKDNYVVRGV